MQPRDIFTLMFHVKHKTTTTSCHLSPLSLRQQAFVYIYLPVEILLPFVFTARVFFSLFFSRA